MKRFAVLGGSSGPKSIGLNCYLYDDGKYITMVDCGGELDGNRKLRGVNLELLKTILGGRKIDVIILTHGHLDHVGAVTTLWRFMKPETKIVFSPQTLAILLKDICEDGLKFSPHLVKAMGVINIRKPERHVIVHPGENEILPGLAIFVIPNGHVPGSFSFILDGNFFQGDYCLHDQPVVRGANLLSEVLREEDRERWRVKRVLSTDLTYGTGEKRKLWDKQKAKVEEVIFETFAGGGTMVLVAAFGFGRGQNKALDIAEFLPTLEERLGYPVTLYVDGSIRRNFKVLQEKRWSDKDREFSLKNIDFVKSSKHREEIINSGKPVIVTTTAGMGDGGPIGDYFIKVLPNEKDTVIFTSYLAPGSTGAKIVKKSKKKGTKIRIPLGPETDEFGNPLQMVDVVENCRVEHLGHTAHADLDDSEKYYGDLVEFQGGKLELMGLAHGIPEAKRAAARRLGKFAKDVVFCEEGTVLTFAE